MYLRACDVLDCRSLAELRSASLIELGLLSPLASEAFSAQAAREFNLLFRSDRIAAWVACDGRRAVASCCAVFYDRLPYPDGSRHAELCGVYVEPEYRKRGLASELVGEVVAAARAGGARKTFLRPSKNAKALYRRLGFADTDLMVAGNAARARSASDPHPCGVAEPLSG